MNRIFIPPANVYDWSVNGTNANDLHKVTFSFRFELNWNNKWIRIIPIEHLVEFPWVQNPNSKIVHSLINIDTSIYFFSSVMFVDCFQPLLVTQTQWTPWTADKYKINGFHLFSSGYKLHVDRRLNNKTKLFMSIIKSSDCLFQINLVCAIAQIDATHRVRCICDACADVDPLPQLNNNHIRSTTCFGACVSKAPWFLFKNNKHDIFGRLKQTGIENKVIRVNRPSTPCITHD